MPGGWGSVISSIPDVASFLEIAGLQQDSLELFSVPSSFPLVDQGSSFTLGEASTIDAFESRSAKLSDQKAMLPIPPSLRPPSHTEENLIKSQRDLANEELKMGSDMLKTCLTKLKNLVWVSQWEKTSVVQWVSRQKSATLQTLAFANGKYDQLLRELKALETIYLDAKAKKATLYMESYRAQFDAKRSAALELRDWYHLTKAELTNWLKEQKRKLEDQMGIRKQELQRLDSTCSEIGETLDKSSYLVGQPRESPDAATEDASKEQVAQKTASESKNVQKTLVSPVAVTGAVENGGNMPISSLQHFVAPVAPTWLFQ